jgi:polysaccharide chain length determinant protein (PEP-CTERM system associated)
MTDTNKPIVLDVRQLFEALVRRWPIVVIPMIVVPLTLLLLKNYLPKQYKVTSQILVQENVSVNPFLEDMSVQWTVKDRLPVIQAIIVSRATLEKALRHLGEIDDTWPLEKVEEKIRDFRQQITVTGAGGGLVNIDVTGNNPAKMYKTLVFLVDVLVEAMLRPQKQSLEDASGFLDKQIIDTREALTKIEKDVEIFKREHAEELPEVFQANLSAYMNSQKDLLTQQTELRATMMRKQNLEQRLRVYNPIARELEAKLVEAKTKLSELRSIYNEDHPEIVALKAHIEQLKNERKSANITAGENIDIESLEGAASLRGGKGASTSQPAADGQGLRSSDLFTSDLLEYKALAGEISALQGSVSELNKHGKDTLESVKSFASTERVLQGLLREFEVKQKTYMTLLEKSEDAKITKALSMFDEDQQIVLIEAPRLPTEPIGLTSKLNAVVGLLAGLLLGITIAILAEFLGGTIRSSQEVEVLIGLPVLGILPLLSAPYESNNDKQRHADRR